jgi:hypothetical protein
LSFAQNSAKYWEIVHRSPTCCNGRESILQDIIQICYISKIPISPISLILSFLIPSFNILDHHKFSIPMELIIEKRPPIEKCRKAIELIVWILDPKLEDPQPIKPTILHLPTVSLHDLFSLKQRHHPTGAHIRRLFIMPLPHNLAHFLAVPNDCEQAL